MRRVAAEVYAPNSKLVGSYARFGFEPTNILRSLQIEIVAVAAFHHLGVATEFLIKQIHEIRRTPPLSLRLFLCNPLVPAGNEHVVYRISRRNRVLPLSRKVRAAVYRRRVVAALRAPPAPAASRAVVFEHRVAERARGVLRHGYAHNAVMVILLAVRPTHPGHAVVEIRAFVGPLRVL